MFSNKEDGSNLYGIINVVFLTRPCPIYYDVCALRLGLEHKTYYNIVN